MNWQNFSWIDWILVIVLITSIGIGVVRGFVREILSLAIWVFAIFNAYLLGDKLATLLGGWIIQPSLRVSAGMAILFVSTLLVGALLNHVLSEMVEKSGLTAADRILGGFFGLARGVIIAMALTLFMPATIKQTMAWRESILVPQFQSWEMGSRETVQGVGAFIHRTITHKI